MLLASSFVFNMRGSSGGSSSRNPRPSFGLTASSDVFYPSNRPSRNQVNTIILTQSLCYVLQAQSRKAVLTRTLLDTLCSQHLALISSYLTSRSYATIDEHFQLCLRDFLITDNLIH